MRIRQLSSDVKSLRTNIMSLIVIYIICLIAIISSIAILLICLQICKPRNENRMPQSQEEIELRQRELADQLYNLNII